MENKLSFGIGCFHFGIKKTSPFKFKGSEYIKELRTALQSISNIDKIDIRYLDEFKNWSFDLAPQELPNIGEGKGFFPKPWYMVIGFEMYIPFRIQAKLLGRKALSLETFTERFKISLHYAYHFPVTFIEPVNPSQESDPSTAVKLVREFLEQEFKSSKSDYIQFEYLGPSPFHANCYIQPGETKDYNNVGWEFQAKIYSQEGYNEVVFYFNPGIFTKAEKAKEIIKEKIQHELGLFYKIVQLEVVKMHNWERIEKLTEDLVSIQRITWVKSFLKKVFILPKHINEAFISIAEFESDEIFFNSTIQNDYRYFYSDKKVDTYFQSYIDNRIKEKLTYPAKQRFQLISFFEGRRIKSVENFVIFITAIISAVIGGVIVVLLTK
ncbi:hypothetical protein ES702_02888 [subsurface metagenome]